MDFTIITGELRENPDCKILQSHMLTSDFLMRKVEYVQSYRGTYYTDCLYLFTDTPVGMPRNFILLTSQGLQLPESAYNDCNYLVVQCEKENYLKIIEFLKVLFDDDARLIVAIHPIILALLADKGLQKLSDMASQALGNPFWCIDMNYNYMTQPYGKISNENILAEMQRGYIADTTIRELRKSKIRDQIFRLNQAFSYQVYDSDRHMMMTAVKIKGVTVAYINVYEENHPFTTYDYRIMNRLSDIFATELQKNTYFRNNRNFMYSYLIADLLGNKYSEMIDLRSRLENMGYHLEKYYYILTLDLSGIEVRDVQLNAIHEQIKHIFQNCIYGIFENHTVYFISTSKLLNPESTEIQKLEEYLNTGALSGALSGSYTDLLLSARQYRTTLEAMRLAKKYQITKHLIFYSDMITTQIIDTCQDKLTYTDLCGGAFQILLESDAEKETEYVQTLYLYYSNNMQIGPTSRALHIHENTLRYRLEKAKALMNYPLNNGQQIMEFMLACEMYQLTKK